MTPLELYQSRVAEVLDWVDAGCPPVTPLLSDVRIGDGDATDFERTEYP